MLEFRLIFIANIFNCLYFLIFVNNSKSEFKCKNASRIYAQINEAYNAIYCTFYFHNCSYRTVLKLKFVNTIGKR